MTSIYQKLAVFILSIGVLFTFTATQQTKKNVDVLSTQVNQSVVTLDGRMSKLELQSMERTEPTGDMSNLGASLAIETPVAWFETSLANEISDTATTMTLNNATTRDGSALASSTYSFTIDEGKATKELVRADCTGTTCTNMQRGISVLDGTSTVTANRYKHRAGASVKITDAPLLLNLTRILNAQGTFPNLLSYTNTVLCGVGSATTTICPKYYIDSVGSSGAANADDVTKGIVERATAAEASSTTALGSTGAALFVGANITSATPGASKVAMSQSTGKLLQGWINLAETWLFSAPVKASSTLEVTGTSTFYGKTFGANVFAQYRASTTLTGGTLPQAVFVATSTNALWPSRADTATNTDFLGFAVENGSNGATTTIQIDGIVNGFTGLTAGVQYYVQNGAGTIGTSMGTAELYVGRAVSTTQLLLDRKDDNMQYLGSGTCSISSGASSGQCDIAPVSPFARFVDVDVNGSSTGGCGTGTFEGQDRKSVV